MGKLWGNQHRFDKDGDGKLNSWEWNDWYLSTYGHDMEMAERRTAHVEVTLSCFIDYHIDLPETWEKMQAAVRALTPGRDAAPALLLGKVLLHEISAAILYCGLPAKPEKMQELEQFLQETPDLHLDAPASFIVQTISSGILYPQEAELSEETCGAFWRALISSLTPEQFDGDDPDGLSDLLYELSSVYDYFGDTGEEEDETVQERRFALTDAFYHHWQETLLLHPDAARAKQLLASGEFPDREDICRDILVTEFPEEAAGYTAETLSEHGWDDLLEDVFERDAAKGLRMWRTLLDIASPCLSSDPGTAQQLLRDWSVLDHPAPGTAETFLAALEDETFAKQVFQSADIGNLQRDLLTVCRNFDRVELGRRCLDLALSNAYLSDAWGRRLRQALIPDSRRPKPQGAPKPAHEESTGDGTVFHYCTVRLQGVRRTYSYLTGDLPLQVGDWVEVPFGKEDRPRCGQITSITDCTRPEAPWPPEQSKTVLRAAEAPAAPETEAAPEQESVPPASPDPAFPEAAQEKGPPVVKKNARTEMETADRRSDTDAVVPQKRTFPRKLACAGLAILIAVTGGAYAFHGWELHYRQAEQQILNGNFSGAAEALDRIPSFFRSQKQLVRYTELCELAQSGTEDDYKTALDGIQNILGSSNGPLKSTMQAQYDAISQQYRDQLYQTALAHLQEQQFDQAQEYLRQILEYPNVNELLCYAQAGSRVPLSKTSAQLKSIMGLLELIPADYDGPFAEEISALRSEVTALISEVTAREKAAEAERARRAEEARKAEEARIAELKAIGIPYIGMPESEIHKTRQLGKAGYSGTDSAYKKDSHGAYYQDTWNVYVWYDANGSMVFQAQCRNNRVFHVSKYGTSAWNGDQLQVKLGPFRPQTFHSGITDNEYSGDTGPGSGHSLRDEYDSPEDLFEDDGTYSDLEEAIDEWEEGW